jgi:hypothetical protein
MERQSQAAVEADEESRPAQKGNSGRQDLDFTSGSAPKLRRGTRGDAEAKRPHKLGYTRQNHPAFGGIWEVYPSTRHGGGVDGPSEPDGGTCSPIPHTARPIFPNGSIAV